MRPLEHRSHVCHQNAVTHQVFELKLERLHASKKIKHVLRPLQICIINIFFNKRLIVFKEFFLAEKNLICLKAGFYVPKKKARNNI